MIANVACLASHTNFVLQLNMKNGTVVEYYVMDISKVKFESQTTIVQLSGGDVTIPSADIQYYTFKNVYALYDGDMYSSPATTKCEELHYFRTFTDTKWQSLYVPFAMSYDDWKDEFEVGAINGVKVSDTDNDGTLDVINIDVIRLESGSIKPNTPYLIRAKEAGEKVIAIENVTLLASEEASIRQSVAGNDVTFTGTYLGISAYNMYTNGYFSFASDSLRLASDLSYNLLPMRWYMSTITKNGELINKDTDVTIEVTDESVGIADVTESTKDGKVYSIDGRLINNGNLKAGIYICNGKKFIVK